MKLESCKFQPASEPAVAPAAQSEAFSLISLIPVVRLNVGKRRYAYTNSRLLMSRLDRIGKDRQVIHSISEIGQPWRPQHVATLNKYLLLCNGLDCFKRVARRAGLGPVSTKYGWEALRSMIGIPRPQPPTHD
jgi:hypothetical protein